MSEDGKECDKMDQWEREVEREVGREVEMCATGEGFSTKTARWSHKRSVMVWNLTVPRRIS